MQTCSYVTNKDQNKCNLKLDPTLTCFRRPSIVDACRAQPPLLVWYTIISALGLGNAMSSSTALLELFTQCS